MAGSSHLNLLAPCSGLKQCGVRVAGCSLECNCWVRFDARGLNKGCVSLCQSPFVVQKYVTIDDDGSIEFPADVLKKCAKSSLFKQR